MAKVIVLGDIRSFKGKVQICKKIQALCRSADIVIANLEGPIVENALPRQGLSSPVKSSNAVLSLLKDLKVSVVTIANNHILDYGLEGLKETTSSLENAGIRWVGASAGDNAKSHYIELPEINAVLFAFSHREGPTCEFLSTGVGPVVLPGKELGAHIQQWKSRGKRVLVSYHGGEEYYNVPWPRRAAWAESITQYGADIVFGHHSHSIQPITKHCSSIIIHGTGNFYFETPRQRMKSGTNEGLLSLIAFEKSIGNIAVEAWKVNSNWEKESIKIVHKMPDQFFNQKLDDLYEQWISETRQFVWLGTLKQNPFSGSSAINRNIRRAKSILLFLWRNLKQRFTSVRDRDIFMSALPLIGKRAVIKMKNGASEFRF